MKNNYLLMVMATIFCLGSYAQTSRTPDGHVRCYTVEADAQRRAQDPTLGTNQDFENWLAPKVAEILEQERNGQRRAITTIPIIFHVIHDGEAVGTGNNLSAALINAQIDQLNQDFRKFGDGANNNPVGADTEIEFCAATLSPTGATLAEPGINRMSASSKGWNSSPFGQCVGPQQNFDDSEIENIVKPQSIWNPEEYLNIWVLEMSCGILGYAQFPNNSGLGGFNNNNGGASTDGVAIIPSSVGSVANPNGNGTYNKGRTLTHEVGHWIGLRHIWGDGGCSVDDYVNDTPASDGANYGCSNPASCGSADMVENYMDYTNDDCMNVFTVGQKARMDAVLANSPRRGVLANSTKCGGSTADTQAPTNPTNLSASNIAQTTATLTWNASSDNVGVTGYDVSLNGSVIGTVTGTSANLTGLVASTTYAASVVAKDAAGNASGAANTNFTTLDPPGANCAGSDVRVSITFDNYPEETSWTIKNSSGSTVATGGTYGSQADGSTLNIDVILVDGSYTFTINDVYGDGICCSYGNGSYALTSGGTTYASGASFTNSEATNFCVEGGAGPCAGQGGDSDGDGVCDNSDQCPGADDALIGTACNDGNACTTGDVYDSNCGCSGTFQDADGDGVCDANDICAAGDDNVDTDGDGIPDACDSGTPGTTELFAHYFESGWDGWIDGGSDCYRYSGTNSWEGSRSIRLRDNSGTISAMTLNNVDVTGYDELELKFYFYPNSMENGEDFWVRVNDGSGYQTVAAYAAGTNFNNGGFYSATVTLSAADYSFNSGFDFRIQCDASSNADQVYVDQVTLTGINNGNARTSSYSIAKVTSTQPEAADEAKELLEVEHSINVYPNPVRDFVRVETEFDNAIIRIYSLSGALVTQYNGLDRTSTIDVSKLEVGTYIIQAQSDEGVVVSKFIKQ